jgi:hypothetical protein
MSSASPIASTSRDSEPSASNPGPVSTSQHQRQRLQDQCDILDRLAEGEGIATYEWDGVIEKCLVCDKIMLEAVFKDHRRECWHVSDDEPESESDEWGMQ